MDVPSKQETSLYDITCAVMRVIAGLSTMEALTDALERFNGEHEDPSQEGVPNPLAILHLAVSSRRLDVLNAVLIGMKNSSPAWRDVWQANQRKGMLDAGVILARGHRQEMGAMIDAVAWLMTNAPDGQERPLLHERDPLFAWCKSREHHEKLWNAAMESLVGESGGEKNGFRIHTRSSALGQAVLMGWPEGVKALLAHGVCPYEPIRRTWNFSSPIMLASIYNERDCLIELMQHPSFRPERSFLFSTPLPTTEQPITIRPFMQWWGSARGGTMSSSMGGIDLEFILRSEHLVQDEQVQQALVDTKRRLAKKKLDALSPEAQHQLRKIEAAVELRSSGEIAKTLPSAQDLGRSIDARINRPTMDDLMAAAKQRVRTQRR